MTPLDPAALQALEPKVLPGTMAAGAHWSDEGHIDPVGVTEKILAKAQANGARLLCPAEVTGLDLARGALRAVRTTAGELPADVMVVACGVDTLRVAAFAGVRVPLLVGVGPNNHQYLETKRDRMGHLIDEGDLADALAQMHEGAER